jgi:hypothetical protein
LCGRRGGEPFLTAERAFKTKHGLRCKRGFKPCDPEGEEDTTICTRVDEEELCPITKI